MFIIISNAPDNRCKASTLQIQHIDSLTDIGPNIDPETQKKVKFDVINLGTVFKETTHRLRDYASNFKRGAVSKVTFYLKGLLYDKTQLVYINGKLVTSNLLSSSNLYKEYMYYYLDKSNINTGTDILVSDYNWKGIRKISFKRFMTKGLKFVFYLKPKKQLGSILTELTSTEFNITNICTKQDSPFDMGRMRLYYCFYNNILSESKDFAYIINVVWQKRMYMKCEFSVPYVF